MEQKKGWREILSGGLTQAGSSEKFKTGDWRARFPVHSKEICINCMMCLVYCPEDCIYQKDDKLEKIDYDYCKGCGICKNVCPVKAIEMYDEKEFAKFNEDPKSYERNKK